ncbi:MAG: SAF domain-containing protein, partial [Actinomycetes bacterium]
MKHRKVTLVLAALLVLVGASGVFAYTSNSSASASTRVTVLAATGDLAPGTAVTALGADQVSPVTVDADSVPAGAMTTLASVSGLKSVTTIF